ncbi:hypothetical protein [Vitiosangium sp. GDMCC 1.1324]|uniref:hypothetical protein n=1 Tax=Vitiosangium sp. (strain GDMCC 1.1324) TaxID=2138576 RepID=UPI000D38C315|nr:hypothetical protein [Vitiosangium sp. GDMCC 1.1324]PTL76927.1 hypothetical protein DAT35_47550 [Vitiosangium sp. GDMCC 1.1324]
MRWAVAWGVLAGLGAGAAGAQEPAGEARDPGYCAFVRGVGDAESAVLLAPDVFASVGVVNAGEAGGNGEGVPLGSPTPRITAGVNYDFVGLYRGLAIRRRAQAECARYRALSALQAAVKRGVDVGAETSLAARAQVLEAAMPEAEQLLASLREDVKEGRATIEELNALQLRLDGLHALERETEKERERLAALPRPAERPLSAWLRDFREADARVEEEDGSLRRASAWKMQLRGGYDELLRVPQEVPLFGSLTVSYNLGSLWQPAANARAREGRRSSLEEDVAGVSQDVARLLRELRGAHAAEEARLREVSVLVADLEGQLKDIQAMETVKVRRYRDYLMLELARLRAEQAWLKAHVAEVGRFLGEEQP